MIDINKLKEFDKYNGESSLLSEPWVNKKKLNITEDEFWLLEKYVDNLYFLNSNSLSACLKKEYNSIISKLEEKIQPDVIKIIKTRIKKAVE